MLKSVFFPLYVGFFLFFGRPALAQMESHPFSVQDLIRMEQISDPRLSPDGKKIAFVVRSTDLEANRGRKDIWLTDIDGKNLQQLTTDPANDSDPVWHMDGKSIWFQRQGSRP